MSHNLSNSTAVLVFAYTPQEELAHKAIPKAGELFASLMEQTLHTVEKSGLPYFHFSEQQQRGSNFGERFTNAIQAVFDKGYDNVITVGNDTPLLKSSHIMCTASALEKGNSVIGPSQDGGFYLMGIHKSQFNAIEFKNLPWQTNQTAKALIGSFKKTNDQILRLETLSDLDCTEDLRDYLRFSTKIPVLLIKLILSILGIESKTVEYAVLSISTDISKRPYNKGSPLVPHY